MRRLRALDAGRIDALLALAIFAIHCEQVAFDESMRGPLAIELLGGAGIALAVAIRSRVPLAAIAVMMTAGTLESAFATAVPDLTIGLMPLVLLPFSVAAREERPRALIGLVVTCVGVGAVDVVSGLYGFGDWAFPMVLVGVMWMVGRVVRQRTRLTAELHEQALLAQERREAQERAAVAAERRRIARELHDVVAHSMSVMVVQAGGGRRILGQDAARAGEAALQIERTGRAALVEMRHLLGALRPDEGTALTLSPQPSLDQLDALVDRARAAGMTVELRRDGEPRELSAGLDLTAYRIVQEALTNALKHAGGAAVDVRVGFGADELALEVADRGPGPARARRPLEAGDGGHGLVGMRERVSLYGGELQTGRRRGGGFRVAARLPLPSVAKAAEAEPQRVPV